MKHLLTLLLTLVLVLYVFPNITYANQNDLDIKPDITKTSTILQDDKDVYTFKSNRDQWLRVVFDADFMPYISISHKGGLVADGNMVQCNEKVMYFNKGQTYYISIEYYAGTGSDYSIRLSSDYKKPHIRCSAAEDGSTYVRWTHWDDSTNKLYIADNKQMKNRQVLNKNNKGYALFDVGDAKELYYQAAIKLSTGKVLKTKVVKYVKE